jgi:hypothetical protein
MLSTPSAMFHRSASWLHQSEIVLPCRWWLAAYVEFMHNHSPLGIFERFRHPTRLSSTPACDQHGRCMRSCILTVLVLWASQSGRLLCDTRETMSAQPGWIGLLEHLQWEPPFSDTFTPDRSAIMAVRAELACMRALVK